MSEKDKRELLEWANRDSETSDSNHFKGAAVLGTLAGALAGYLVYSNYSHKETTRDVEHELGLDDEDYVTEEHYEEI